MAVAGNQPQILIFIRLDDHQLYILNTVLQIVESNPHLRQ